MKKTQEKDAARNIKKRFVSFLSVALVSALGLGGLFLTNYMAAGLGKKAEEYYIEHNFKDFDYVSSLGISEANMEKIRSVEGVAAAEGVVQADANVEHNGEKYNATVISLTEDVSVPELVEGELPQGADECLIGADFAEIAGIEVGDRVRLSLSGVGTLKSAGSQEDSGLADSSDDNKDADKDTDHDTDTGRDASVLRTNAFTVTGLMDHPDYMRRKSVNTVTVPLDVFNKEVTQGLFTRAFVRIEPPENTGLFDDQYFDRTEGTRSALEELLPELEADRAQEMKDEANARIDEEWAKAEAELAEAQRQIDSGEAELDAKLTQGRNKLNNAQSTLDRRIAEYNRKLKNGEITIPKYKKTIKQLKSMLAKAKKAVKKARKIYEKKVKVLAPIHKEVKWLIENYDLLPAGSGETEKAIAQFIIDNQETIRDIKKYSDDNEFRKSVRKLDDWTGGKAGAEQLAAVDAIDAEELIETAEKVLNGEEHFDKSLLQKIDEMLDAFEASKAELDEADRKIAAYEKQIAEGEKEIKREINAEQKKYQSKIDNGWAKYYAEKSAYEAKLEEAKALLAENEEKANEKLAEVREEVDKISCSWILLDRKANAGYVDIKSNITAIEKSGFILGVLFMIVTAIVCFSTLVIIIDEQKKLIGTTKAFGFFKNEILMKYLSFGILSALLGCIIAIAVSLAGSGAVQGIFADSGMYLMEKADTVIMPGITAAGCLIIIAVTAFASVFACLDVLRSPASVLMKGAVSGKKNKKKKTVKEAGKGGSLYSRLIIRNMREDKARVIVTIAVIAFSCMMMGVGMSLKYAFDGMVDKQMTLVNKYDVRVALGDETTPEEQEGITEVLQAKGTKYLPSTVETRLYDWGGRMDGLQLICADPAQLGEYYSVHDLKTGESVPIPESGILIQKRMHESYDMNVGDTIPLLDDALEPHDAVVKGCFANYVGRTVVASPSAYKEIFGEKNEINNYYVKLNGADSVKLREALLEVSPDILYEENGVFKAKFATVGMLYNIIVAITMFISVLMSFMILTNMSNIFLNRKKTELTIMRINGFTVRETRQYLSKESIITTAAGILLGVLIGAVITPWIIMSIQQPDLEFDKTFHLTAWIIAVGLETVFAVIINTLVFRKVKDLNLRDIA